MRTQRPTNLVTATWLLTLALSAAVLGCGQPDSSTISDTIQARDGGGRLVGDSQPPACNATDPRVAPVEVSVMPDDGEKPYVDVISRATKRIRVMIYMMGYGGILDGLKSKASQGVDVRVILDQGKSSNQKYYKELTAAGVKVLWSDPVFPYMHAKVIIGDTREAIISTGNFSLTYAIKRSRDFTVRTADPQDVADLIGLFEADWSDKKPDLSCTRLLISPINARQRLLSLIASAKTSVSVESMQLADKEIRAALAARKQAGVAVRVLLADPGWISSNSYALSFLKGSGIQARWMKTPSVHSKMIVVDGARAYVGSVNFSYTSLTKNREVGLIFSSPGAVKRAVDTFDGDWSATPAL